MSNVIFLQNYPFIMNDYYADDQDHFISVSKFFFTINIVMSEIHLLFLYYCLEKLDSHIYGNIIVLQCDATCLSS